MASKPVLTRPSPRVIANRRNGQKGGLATAKKYGKDFCVSRSERAGQALRDMYGADYYSHIGKFRKKVGWPKGKPRKSVTINPAQAVLNQPAP